MTDQGLVKGLASVLLVTVASQIFYITVVSGSDNEMLRPLTWFTELIAFSVSAIFALALSSRRPAQAVVWSTIALAGVLNVLQVGMGLSMFAPAMEASEMVPQLFGSILAGAFFLYFLAKMLLGAAGLLLGLGAIAGSGKVPTLLGAATAIAGVASVGCSMLAMIDAEGWRFAAGAAGTGATGLVAILLLVYTPLAVAR